MRQLPAILLLCAGVTGYGQGQPCVADSCCLEGTVWSPSQGGCVLDENYCSWQPDSDGDQLIGVSDLLMFLSVFGDTDLDQDGIFDSNDDCVGEYDECGVCNGSGPSIPIIESIEILYDSVYAEQIDEWWVFEVGADTLFNYVCELIEGCTDPSADSYDEDAHIDDGSCWSCGDSLAYQGYDYSTVEMEGRCWFQESLKASNYRSDEEIPAFNGVHGGEGFVSLQGSWFYQWASATFTGGLCPQGWSVPSVADYSTLISANNNAPLLYPHPYASLLVGYVDSDVPIQSPYINQSGTNEYSWTSDVGGIAFRQTSSTVELDETLQGNAFTVRCIKD